MSQTITATGLVSNNDGKTVTLSYTLSDSSGVTRTKMYPYTIPSSDILSDMQVIINQVNAEDTAVADLYTDVVTGTPISPQ
jgi:hypothetical protein